jgi:hypothetical protein
MVKHEAVSMVAVIGAREECGEEIKACGTHKRQKKIKAEELIVIPKSILPPINTRVLLNLWKATDECYWKILKKRIELNSAC